MNKMKNYAKIDDLNKIWKKKYVKKMKKKYHNNEKIEKTLKNKLISLDQKQRGMEIRYFCSSRFFSGMSYKSQIPNSYRSMKKKKFSFLLCYEDSISWINNRSLFDCLSYFSKCLINMVIALRNIVQCHLCIRVSLIW